MEPHELNKEVGNIDLYLLDQILKNRFKKNMKILDAGCGEGRNSHFFVKNGYNIYGIDNDSNAIRMAKMIFRSINSEISENFLQSELSLTPFTDNFFDAVICCSVLHFSRDTIHFEEIIQEIGRILKPQGTLLIRMSDRKG